MFYSRVHESTISKFVPSVCDAIITNLKDIHLKTPNTVDEWKEIANGFSTLWNFPLCLGALDGRHITFRAPISDGSYYYNYKNTNSIVLLALADAHYKFTYVNIGVNGRISDGGVFSQSTLSKALSSNMLNFPPDEVQLGCSTDIPYVIVADDAFPLLRNLLKPYPQRHLDHDSRIFNYRLSRARRIIENAFGILANRFRVLLNPINLSVEKVEKITLTCVILHNYLATNAPKYIDMPADAVEQLQLTNIGQQGGNKSSSVAREVRDKFKVFFNSEEGAVDWQERAINNFNM